MSESLQRKNTILKFEVDQLNNEVQRLNKERDNIFDECQDLKRKLGIPIQFNLDFLFYGKNDFGIVCVPMDLNGMFVRCTQEIDGFKSGKVYEVFDHTNDRIILEDNELREIAEKENEEFEQYDFLLSDYVHVTDFENGRFTLLSKSN